MPPRESKNSNAIALLRRAGTEPVMSMVKAGIGLEMSSAITRMILRNIHLAIWSRKEEEVIVLNSTGNSYATEQRDGAEPAMRFVRVAVKPSLSKSKGNMWADESVNWEASSKKWTGGLNSRPRKNKPSHPPFVLKEIPYDDWRKHYAKDKTGLYRGTEAPAEDCILLAEDEVKWRSGPAEGEDNQSAQSEDASPHLEPVKRSATFPKHQDVNSVLSPPTKQAPGDPKQKAEAVFIEDDGHTASQIVEEPKTGYVSPTSSTPPTSPASPISLNSPTCPASERNCKNRVETYTQGVMRERSSPVQVIQQC